jgi:hypothetical protein
MNIGVFSCDPGGATGLTWGIFNPHAGSIEKILASKLEDGSTTVTGDERTQIREVATLWQSFFSGCVRSALLPPERVWFVCEDYIYAPGVNYEGDSAKISTALIWGIEGYRMGRADEFRVGRGRKQVHVPTMILQPAGMAKSYATKERLKEWGMWERGHGGKREHEFSALQHLVFFLHRYSIQHG